MVLLALRPSKHRIVVRHQHAARMRLIEAAAVDAADPRDDPVRRRALDQVVEFAAAALRGDHKRSVFNEGARIAEVGDILTRRALAGLAPPRDRVGPGLIEPDRVTFPHLGKIRPDVIEVGSRSLGRSASPQLRPLR